MLSLTLFALLILSLLGNISGNFDENFYRKWIEKYQKISGNLTPPLKYKEWISLANQHGLSYNPEDYDQIFKDLKPYKSQKWTVPKLKNLESKLISMGVNVKGSDMEELKLKRLRWPFQNILNYLESVLDPKINFYVITHFYDESIVAPADDDQIRPYTDMEDLIKRCKAVRDVHKDYLDGNILLRAPSSFVAVPFDVPLFSVNRIKGFRDIILPSDRTGLGPYIFDYQTAIDSPVWEAKLKMAVFRGRTTGINFKKARAEHIPLTLSPRFKLAEMAIQQKEGKLTCSVPLDFGITEIWQCEENEEYVNEITRQFPLVPVLDYDTQFKSKYLVVVDGNGWPDRIAFFLLSGSLLFLATVSDDWVINQCIPGIHYINVKPDLSDLVEKIEWAAQNDAEAKIIAANGRELAQKQFSAKSMQVYNSLLFMEYQRLFQ